MSDRILVATRKGLFDVRKGAQGWRIECTSFLGDPITAVLRDPRTGFVYAAQKHEQFGARLFRSMDDGSGFEACGTPAYPPKPEGEPDNEQMGQRPVPWSLKTMWALEPGHADQPGLLWCGTIPGGLFRSLDNGATWELVRSLWDHPLRKQWFGGGAEFPGIHSICIHPQDPRRLAIAISCGGVWHSADLGESWELHGQGLRAAYVPPEKAMETIVQDPHLMVQCPAQPERVWIQHHNGIFRSDDSGKTFSEIKELGASTFGFAVAVHPTKPDTAWFVPATKDEIRIPVGGRLSVTRTQDAGQTATQLTCGFPAEHTYDLVYRHALAIDSTGTRLAFGSTTGGLWITEDGGDRWSELSSHLPPVYAVRFV